MMALLTTLFMCGDIVVMKYIINTPNKLKLYIYKNNQQCKKVSVNHRQIFECNILDSITISTTEKASNRKTNVLGFVFLSFIAFFLETQKTFEKRYFTSYYNVVEDLLFADCCFTIDKEINFTINLMTQEFKNLKVYYWSCAEQRIINKFNFKEMKRRYIELIGFWFIVTNTPSIILIGLTVYRWLISESIIEPMVFIIVFLEMTFIMSLCVFSNEYRKIKKYTNNLS